MSRIFPRRLRWTLLALAGCAVAYAWAMVTPQVGQPVPIGQTDGGKLWSFGFVGDTQSGEGIVEPIFARLREADVDFVLHLGDLVEEADADEQWTFLLDQAEKHGLRLRPVVGNHDILREQGDRGERRFSQFFPDLPGTFYGFSHRGLNFAMLNSERSFLPWTEQGRFLRSNLAAEQFNVVCLHRPVFTCGHRDWPKQVNRRLWLHRLFSDGGVTLVLAGHHHYYDRCRPLDGVTYVVSGGGSRKLYGAEKPNERTAAFRSGANHFGVVDVYRDCLRVHVLDVKGKSIDDFCVSLDRRSADSDLKASKTVAYVNPQPTAGMSAATSAPSMLQ